MTDFSKSTELQESDFKYFVENYRELWKIYGDCYLLISNKQILGKFHKPGDAVHEGLRIKGPGNFIVQQCLNDESCFTAEAVNVWI